MKGAIESVLVALNGADVRYLIVGGVGVVLHGYLRTTMTDTTQETLSAGFEKHWLDQVRRGLLLTPVQRLAWLETTMSEMSTWVGRARESGVKPVASPSK